MGEYLEQQYDEREYALELAKKHKLLHEDKENMTWGELKKKAKEMGYDISGGDDIHTYTLNLDVYVYEYGTISLKDGWGAEVYIEHRTPDQMLAIMKALQ